MDGNSLDMINAALGVLIAGLGVIIACLQLRLSKQINRQEVIKVSVDALLSYFNTTLT